MPTFALDADAAAAARPRARVAAATPVQSFLFAHTPSVVLYDCPGR